MKVTRNVRYTNEYSRNHKIDKNTNIRIYSDILWGFFFDFDKYNPKEFKEYTYKII